MGLVTQLCGLLILARVIAHESTSKHRVERPVTARRIKFLSHRVQPHRPFWDQVQKFHIALLVLLSDGNNQT